MDYGNPISYLVLEPGAEAICSDGTPVGKVTRVLADADAGIFDGLVIDIEGSLHFADAYQVGNLYERAVLLKLSVAEAQSLPKPTHNRE